MIRTVSAFEVTPDGAGVYFLVRDFGSGNSRSFVGYAEFSNPSQAVVLGQTDGAQPPGVEPFSVDSAGERVVYVISGYDTASQTYSRRVEVAEMFHFLTVLVPVLVLTAITRDGSGAALISWIIVAVGSGGEWGIVPLVYKRTI
jgi:hypothetical protein